MSLATESSVPVDVRRDPFPRAISTAPTIVHALRYWAAATPDRLQHVFLGDGDEPTASTTYAELDRRARAVGEALSGHVTRGDRVLLLLGPGPEFFAAFYGCLYAGIRPVPLPPPGRPRRDLPKLRAVVDNADARIALATAPVVKRLDSDYAELELEALDVAELAAREPGGWEPRPLAPEDVAYLQYTSGSTSSPKGVEVTHQNVMANVRWIVPKYGHDLPGATTGTWLPCYHDMGLVGDRITPIYAGLPVYELPAIDFIKRPIRWLRMISRYRVTVAGAPNFAYQACVSRVSREDCEGLDLSSWRVAYNGAEPVRAETLRAFQEKLAPHGLPPTALHPCYGLAEATLFVTTNDVGEPPVIREFPTAALRSSGQVFSDVGDGSGDATTVLVGCGRSPAGGRVAIVDPATSTEVEPGCIGEIWLASPSITSGYHRRADETRETFGATLADRPDRTYLRTGDLGFFLEGQLFISGRLKEVLKLHGRNVYPQDLEWTAETSHDVLGDSGCCAIAGTREGEESVVIVAELSGDAYVELRRAERGRAQGLDLKHVRRAVQSAVSEQHELFVEVVFVAPGTIPKTSSGKKRRYALRSSFANGELASLGC